MSKTILIVEDDISFGTMLQKWIAKNGYEPLYCSTVGDAKVMIENEKIDLIISDLRLPDGDGIMLLHWMSEVNRSVPMILMSGYGEVSIAVSAMKLGAEDFLEKPIVPSLLKQKIDKIFNRFELSGGSAGSTTFSAAGSLAGSSEGRDVKHPMVMGSSPSAVTMYQYINKIAPTNFTILVLGESGTGKEYTANLIHNLSNRKGKPFIAIDCGSLSKELAPSELFGHLKGSFTSAINNKKGAFELADGGTIFLDEVGNLSYEVQVQLLRALQEQKIRPVGASKDIKIDVRIIAATNENLLDAISQGKFREDLYHRLNEFSLFVPPLRDRVEDIEIFANAFIKDSNRELNKSIKGISKQAVELLKRHTWSGNIRELRNVIRRATLFAQDGEMLSENDFYDLQSQLQSQLNSHSKTPLVRGVRGEDSASEDFSLKPGNEKEQIEMVLQRTRGNKTLAAQLLKIDRKTLYNKMHLYNIEL